MARSRRRVKGQASVRRVLRALPEAARDEIVQVLDSGSVDLQRLVVAATPRRTGDLRAGIKRRVLKRTLRMQVGLIGTKAGRAKLFYGRILDLGRKAQSVRVNRKGGAILHDARPPDRTKALCKRSLSRCAQDHERPPERHLGPCSAHGRNGDK